MTNLARICYGIYLAEEVLESEIYHDGLKLQRFMNVFYLHSGTDELTPTEVEELCRARAAHPSSFKGGANNEVRSVFKNFIRLLQPARLLEVGAGTNPLFSSDEATSSGIFYVKSDADPMNAETEIVFSGTEVNLQYSAGYFDFAVAIFVLHFKFYDVQIAELSRCLNQSGLFIANIYRRSLASRNGLIEQFQQHGFSCRLIDDPHSLCQEHQYMLAAKDGDVLQDAVQRFEASLVGAM